MPPHVRRALLHDVYEILGRYSVPYSFVGRYTVTYPSVVSIRAVAHSLYVKPLRIRRQLFRCIFVGAPFHPTKHWSDDTQLRVRRALMYARACTSTITPNDIYIYIYKYMHRTFHCYVPVGR